VVQSDGELAEAMSEFIENLVLTNVGCFLSAAERLDDGTMKHLIRFYLMTPLYHEQSEILPIIERALKKGQFPKFDDAYFNISKSTR
jgi:hypothetical protein